MKSYTDITQSKKLIELGIDVNTADMWWNTEKHYPEFVKTYREHLGEQISPIPVWSLAALIETLPLGIDIHNITDGHKIYYYVEIYTKEIYMKLKRMNKPEICLSTERHENLVDACVEMIVTLKERNLL